MLPQKVLGLQARGLVLEQVNDAGQLLQRELKVMEPVGWEGPPPALWIVLELALWFEEVVVLAQVLPQQVLGAQV